MDQEIERKWIVDSDIASEQMRENATHHISVAQGYVKGTGDTEVRVRRAVDVNAGTYRFSITVKYGEGLEREEADAGVPEHAFATLWPATEGHRVRKMRHIIPIDGATVELDRYADTGGLCVAEVEFGSADAAHAFEPLAWFGEEVTGDVEYSNRRIAERC